MSAPGVSVYRAEPGPPSSPGPARRGGVSPFAWANTHRLQAGGIIAGAVAAFAYWRSKSAASAAAGGGTGTTASVAGTDGTDTAGLVSPDTSTSDIENWVQDQLNAEQASVDAQLAASQPPTGATTPPPTTTTSGGTSSGYKVKLAPGGQFVVPGSFNSTQGLRSVAAALTPGGNPNAVETTLRALVAANPGLRDKTTAPGGHLLKMPSGIG